MGRRPLAVKVVLLALFVAFADDWRVDVLFAKELHDPASWSPPRRLITGGRWYPQVIGTQFGIRTDKIAGKRARFFMGGRSQYLI